MENLLERIKQKIYRIYLVLFKNEFKYYSILTEFKSTFLRSKPYTTKLSIIKSDDKISSFKINDNNFIFYYPSVDLCVPALTWSYYHVVANTYSGHYYEKYKAKVEKGDIVMDCGACEGFFTYKIKDIAKNIYCFEPNDKMAECLKETFIDYMNVKVINKGVGKETGYSLFSGSNNAEFRKDLCNARQQGKRVEIISIDEFVAENQIERVDYIKADVEGSEMDLIYGAKEVIKKFKPKISITTYHYAKDATQIVEAVLKLESNYKYRLCGMYATGFFKEAKDYKIPRPTMAHFWIQKASQ